MAGNKDLDINALRIPPSVTAALRLSREAARPAAWADRIAAHTQPLVAVDFGARLLRRFDLAGAPGVWASALSERFSAAASQPAGGELPLARQPEVAPRLGQARWSGPAWPAAARAASAEPFPAADATPGPASQPLIGDLDALGWGQPAVDRSPASSVPAAQPLGATPPSAPPLRGSAEKPALSADQPPAAPALARHAIASDSPPAAPGAPPAAASAERLPAAGPASAPARVDRAAGATPSAPAPSSQPPAAGQPAAALDLPSLRTAAMRSTALIRRLPASPLERMGLAPPESLGSSQAAPGSIQLPALDQPVARRAAAPRPAAPPSGVTSAAAPATAPGQIARSAPPTAPARGEVARSAAAPEPPASSTAAIPVAGGEPNLPLARASDAADGAAIEHPAPAALDTREPLESPPAAQASQAPGAAEPTLARSAPAASAAERPPAPIWRSAEPNLSARQAEGLATGGAHPTPTSPWLLTTLLLQRHASGPGLSAAAPLLLRTWPAARTAQRASAAGSPAMLRTSGAAPQGASAPAAALRSSPGRAAETPGRGSVARSAILAPLAPVADMPIASQPRWGAAGLPALASPASASLESEPRPSAAGSPADAQDGSNELDPAPIERAFDWGALPLLPIVERRSAAPGSARPAEPIGARSLALSSRVARTLAGSISQRAAEPRAPGGSAPAFEAYSMPPAEQPEAGWQTGQFEASPLPLAEQAEAAPEWRAQQLDRFWQPPAGDAEPASLGRSYGLPMARSIGWGAQAQPATVLASRWNAGGRSYDLARSPALDLVQPRQAEIQRAEIASPPVPSASEAGSPGTPGAAAPAGPTTEELANKVYEHLRRRLLIDQERRGRLR